VPWGNASHTFLWLIPGLDTQPLLQVLREDYLLTRFDGLPQTHFICQNGAFGKPGLERGECSFDSVRFRSICASNTAPASLSKQSKAQRSVSSWAKYFVW
jgi:hypothetical protein